MNLLEAIEEEVYELYRKHNLDAEWSFKFDRSSKRYGSCNYNEKRITLSPILSALNERDETTQVILHEIAHALAGTNHGHDRTWMQIARDIGYHGYRTYSKEVVQPKAKYRYECSNCGKFVSRERKTNGRRSCVACGGPKFNANFVMEYKENR